MSRAALALLLALLALGASDAAAAPFEVPPATPRADCGPGSRPAPGLQGRVTADAPDDGYTCNTEMVSHEGSAGGFKVERFVDREGRQCAYYDTTLLFPVQAIQQLEDGPTGVAVVDMTDPERPQRTETLVTPAMQSPHESLLVNERRGLLVAVMGNPFVYPGFVDVYDLNADCRHPQLQSSLPVGLLGHESGFAPDGLTFYATSLFNDTVTAVDLTNPKVPLTIWTARYPSHGFTVSPDGNRGYVAGLGVGLIIVDTSEIQSRQPVPEVREVSRLTWPTLSIPQVALPVTFGGKPHLVEIDEFSVDSDGSQIAVAANGDKVGAARIIDISDERAPRVISDIRLEVHQPEHRAETAGDPGATSFVQGYAGHYCNVERQDDPQVLACSMVNSGLRVFDISDPRAPREVAYFVAPPAASPVSDERSNNAISRPAFDVARRQIWYSDGNSGLYAVRLTNGAWPSGAGAEPRPRLALRVRPARTGTGCRRFRFRVTTRAGGRAVRGATVAFGRKRVRTNGRGRARVRRCLPSAGRYRARATRTGYRGARAFVRASGGRSGARFTG